MLITIVVCSIFGSFLLLLAAGLLYRNLRQQQQARVLALQTPKKIEEGQFVQIGNLVQWIQIRGENRDNPVLLILHGGPGIAFSALTPIFRTWEHSFTIVQWDQPGAGKTASRNGKAKNNHALTIEGMVQDSIQVAEWVLRHLHQQKLILLGVSWGTVLGTTMVKRRPDLFWAYVGSGQFVDGIPSQRASYELALERLRERGDVTTLQALQATGSPPYSDMKTFLAKQQAIGKVAMETTNGRRFPNMLSLALFAPGYSLKDSYTWLFGSQLPSATKLHPEIMAYDARQLGTTFEIPLFFFQGTLDIYTPARPVEEYVATIQAPHKELQLWENEAHLTFLTNPEKILGELVARVRPLATGGAPN